VRLAKQDFRGHAYYKLVSIGFGDKEVAVDEQQLERNLPQLVEIAEGLAQSRMLPLILDSNSLIQGAREKIARRSAKTASLTLVQEVLAVGCGWACFGCGIALAGYGLGIYTLITSCAATFGTTCIVALVGSRIAAIDLVMDCVDCIECVLD
jgi:hypothetical protein